MTDIPFPYKNPNIGQLSSFSKIGDEKTAGAMLHMAEIFFDKFYRKFMTEMQSGKGVDVRLDQTLFLYCLERAASKLPEFPSVYERMPAAHGGRAELPHVDGMFIVGSHVAAAISCIRPLQFISTPSLNNTVLLHINDIFALEYGWIISLWLINFYEAPNSATSPKEIFDQLTWNLLEFRSWWEKAQSMFQYMALENADPVTLAVFYDSLPHHAEK